MRSERHNRRDVGRWTWRDTASNAHFRCLDDGRLVFYPAGEYGRLGYIVATPDQEYLLRSRVREWRHGLTLLGVLVGEFLGVHIETMSSWLFAVGVIGWWIFLLGIDHLTVRAITRHMDRADVANSPVAYWRSMGRSSYPLLLLAQVAFAIVMTGGLLYLFTLSHDWIVVAFAVLATGTLLVPAIVALNSRWASRSE